jgi:hypothetical protein
VCPEERLLNASPLGEATVAQLRQGRIPEGENGAQASDQGDLDGTRIVLGPAIDHATGGHIANERREAT